jgi:hypothetical protein
MNKFLFVLSGQEKSSPRCQWLTAQDDWSRIAKGGKEVRVVA